MDLNAIEPIIEQIVKDSLDKRVYQYGKNGNLTNRVASGNLRNSIKAVVKPSKQGIQIIELQSNGKPLSNTYAYWLINDRKPGPAIGSQKGRKKTGNYQPGPFVSAIEEWIKNKKSFRMRNFKTGQYIAKNDKTIKQAAYVIARSIGKFGFKNKPQNFIEVSIDMLMKNEKIIQILEGQAFEDLLNAIEGI
jgi:hypothetical protein